MKRFTVLAFTAWFALAIPLAFVRSDSQKALAQTVAPSCPTLGIVSIWPRSLAVWLVIGSDQQATTPVTIELTTESEIAVYSLPAIAFAARIGDAAGGYRSAPIALVAPSGNVLFADLRPTMAGATCSHATRVLRFADASGVYNLAQRSDEDIAFEKMVVVEARGPDKAVGVTTRRNAAPFDCKVPHRDARTLQPVEPEYPRRARELGQVGNVQIKVSISATGAVLDASLYRSSGSEYLDEAALTSAKATTYAPRVENCFPVAGAYLFRADFTAVRRPQ